MLYFIVPQRELLNKLARDDYAVIDAEDRVWFRDVYDHMVRMHDINGSMRDLMISRCKGAPEGSNHVKA
jgi:magnesium transporter